MKPEEETGKFASETGMSSIRPYSKSQLVFSGETISGAGQGRGRPEKKKIGSFFSFFFSPARREWDFPGNQTGGRKREGICVRSFDEEENWWAADVVMVTPPE